MAETSKKKTRAAIYLRISQDRDGTMLGVDRQREDCVELCKRNGWAVIEEFVDNDISAYSKRKRRPSYQALLEALKDGRADAVVAWHPDRLHRSPRELEDFIDLVEATGARVATARAGEYDLSTDTGRMVARIVGAVARGESERKADRIGRQREQAARSGKYHGGRRPFGYERGGVVVNETEAELVREAVGRVLAGESMRVLADDWNARSIPTSSGGRWKITTLRTMLAGPRLAGLRVHQGDVIGDAVWPAIIDRETFERVRAVLGDPRRHQRGRPPAFLLSSLLRCGRCGEIMHAGTRAHDGARRWVCNKQPGKEACGRVAIVAAPLEELITEAVLYRVSSPRVERAMRKPKRTAGPDYGAVINDGERKLEELAELFGAGELGRREWLAAKAKVDERLKVARRALAREQGTEALAPLRDVDPRAAWASLDTERRRGVLGALIERVVVGPANGRSVFAPDRVEVVWRV